MFTAGLLVYAETRAFTSDEGFHLLAAQLIRRGMRPYLDFAFPQPPLNAYWNAAWFAVLGESWRVPHAISALLTGGAAFLTATYWFRRMPVEEWRFPGAITVALMTGMNGMVTAYGPIAQAYGIGLFLSVAAFRVAVAGVERRGVWLAAITGLFASASAACTLLTAPVLPVLLLWTFFWNRAGSRWLKSIAFAIAALLPWLPVARLALLEPSVVWFNLVRYHTEFRALYWAKTTDHDIDILSSFINSGQALSLLLLAISGVVFLRYRATWDDALRREIYLSAALALAMGAEMSRAHPTFSRYFLFCVPFLAIPALAGLYAIGSRVFEPDRPFWPVAVVCCISIVGCARTLYDRKDMYLWQDYEKLAGKIAKLTPPGGQPFADDHIYFLLKRRPPPGFEFVYSHKLNLPAAEEAKLHLVPEAEEDRQLSSGMYNPVYLCESDEYYQKLGLAKLYPHQEDEDDCTLFWK